MENKSLGDPIGRFHRTFAVIFSLIFGNLDQALTAARRLHRRHARITGTLKADAGRYPKGSEYSATELSARQWVYATLTDTTVMAYELVLPELRVDERER
jgi:uncharacterized protein (DUF2236 family)